MADPGLGGVLFTRIINADSGKFVLKINPYHTKAQIEFEIDVLKHLEKAGFPSPRPEQAVDGAYVKELNGKPCTMFSYIEGSTFSSISRNLFSDINPRGFASEMRRWIRAGQCQPKMELHKGFLPGKGNA